MAKWKAHGFKLYKDNGDNSLTKHVIQLITISPSGAAADQIQATDHDSPAGFHEYLGGVVNPGTFTCEVHWDPTDTVHHEILATDIANGQAERYQLHFPPQILPAPSPWEMDIVPIGFAPDMNATDVLKGTFTFQISGQIDYSATAWT